jgi:6-phosphogluconate dehydrogenase
MLFDPYFKAKINDAQKSLRQILTAGIKAGIPQPCLSSTLNYYDGLRAAVLPANLLQAQRDYFGAHMYERVDAPRGEWFHTNWTGEGGDATSSAYSR